MTSIEPFQKPSRMQQNLGATPVARRDFGGLVLSIVALASALIWIFPIYWGVMTSFKPDYQVVEPGFNPWPRTFTLESYAYILTYTNILIWYVNSVATLALTTAGVITIGASAGYALSQLRFPGRTLHWFVILGSFIVPIQALIVNHFILMAQFKLINSWLGIILPQLVVPITVIVYKQFFDTVPKEYREAAAMDSASELRIFLKIVLPMNWGVTTALAIVTFIGVWNAFLWPFLVTTKDEYMTVSVGITQVRNSFGIQYARELAAAVLVALPVVVLYMAFQRRITQAIMLSAGIKG